MPHLALVSVMRRWLQAYQSDPPPPAKRHQSLQSISGRSWLTGSDDETAIPLRSWVSCSDDEADDDATVWQRRLGTQGTTSSEARVSESRRPGVRDPVQTVDTVAQGQKSRVNVFALDLNAMSLRLRAQHAIVQIRKNITKRESKAMSPARVGSLLQSGSCSCTQKCLTKVLAFKAELLQILQWWHGHLTRSDRTILLSTLYDAQSRGDAFTRTTWSVCGHQVCLDAFCKVLGSHKSTIYDMARGIPCQRILRPRESVQTHRVHQFFLELYMSAAEPMPHESYMIKGPPSMIYIPNCVVGSAAAAAAAVQQQQQHQQSLQQTFDSR